MKEPKLAGMFLDSRPSDPNRALQMETQYVPSVQAVDSKGETWARIAPTAFPRNAQGESMVVHNVTAYNKSALWDRVKTWFEGGEPVAGTIDPKGSVLHTFQSKGGSTWKIYGPNTPKEDKLSLAWNSFASPVALDDHTYGYRWNSDLVAKTESKNGPLVTLPEYFHLVKGENGKGQWVVVSPKDVPAETGLTTFKFQRPPAERPEPYVTPDKAMSPWKTPGPVAGPFEAHPGDGSVVTYYWYRFADQPALLNADLSDQEREQLQASV